LGFSQVYTVYDTQKNEIFGYLVFELSEKISKKEYVYSTTLLDVDSQKQKETTFSDLGKIRIGNVLYNGTSIYFEVLPEDTEDDVTIGTRDFSYRIYNLDANTISPKFELAEHHKKTLVVASYPIENTGFGLVLNNSKTNVNQLYAVSDNNELLYDAYPFGNPEKKKKQTEEISIGDMQGDLLVTINKIAPKGKNKKAYTSLLFVNAKSGDTIKETVLNSEKFKMDLNKAKIVGDEVWAFADAYGKKKSINSGKVEGLVKTTLDLEGNIKDQKEVTWEDLKPIVKIKKGGKKKGKGLMHTHDFVVDQNSNHVIMVGEYLKGSRSRIKVKDMYFLDFDADFNLTQLYEVKTNTSTLYINDISAKGAKQYGAIVKEYKYFDYKFHNQIDNGLSFYYFNTEKRGLLGGRKLPQGVVVYKDGVFNSAPLTWNKRNWKSEKLNLLPSKTGYILASKVSENKVEANLHPIEITTVEVIETDTENN
jgi:hypothetical protein